MTKYYIPSLGAYVDDKKQNVIDEITYPRSTIKAFFPDAQAAPSAGEYQRVIQGNDGWVIEDWSPKEISASKQSVLDVAIRKVWQERYNIANDPMYGLDPAGAVIVKQAADAGHPLAIAISDWVQGLYNEAVSREQAILNGDTPGEWLSPKEKPYSVSDILA